MDRRLVLGAALSCCLPQFAQAQSGQVTKFVIPFGTGNATDTGMRILVESLRAATGQAFIVENRPGGGGVIAATAVARAKPDGATYLVTTAGHITNAVLHSKSPYDPVEDYTPVTLLTLTRGFVLMVRNDSRFATAQDFIAAARAKSGSITYGSFGVGNTTHVMGELFARAINAKLTHVPYGSPIADFLAGHIDCIFIGESSIAPLMKGGQARPLATSYHKRSPAIPDTPTFAELGIKNADVPAWSAVLAPKGVPAEQVQSLYLAMKEAAKSSEYQNQVKVSGVELALMPPGEFGTYLKEETARLRGLLPPLGIRLE